MDDSKPTSLDVTNRGEELAEVAIGLGVTAAALSALEDPAPGQGGWWGRLSVRQRSLFRLALAAVCFALLGGLSWVVVGVLHFGLDRGEGGRMLLGIPCVVLGFGGVYLAVWGLAGLLLGRPFRTLSPLAGILCLVLFTPLVTIPTFALIVFPRGCVALVKQFAGQGLQALHPGASELRAHVLKLDALFDVCQKDREPCDRAGINTEVAAVEAVVAAHPGLAHFQVYVPSRDFGNGYETLYDMDRVRWMRYPSLPPQ